MNSKRLIIFICLTGLLCLPAFLVQAGPKIHSNGLKPSIAAGFEIMFTEATEVEFYKLTVVELVARNLARSRPVTIGPTKYYRFIEEVAVNNGVPSALVKAVIHAESGFDPDAVSSRGAIGLMQVMPRTADMVGLSDPYHPFENIQAGVKYLKDMLDMFKGNEILAVAAYNSGPRKVKKFGGVPPYRETRRYVKKVFAYYRSYSKPEES
jgi:soluble lytic murein transglycosylase-like protein